MKKNIVYLEKNNNKIFFNNKECSDDNLNALLDSILVFDNNICNNLSDIITIMGSHHKTNSSNTLSFSFNEIINLIEKKSIIKNITKEF